MVQQLCQLLVPCEVRLTLVTWCAVVRSEGLDLCQKQGFSETQRGWQSIPLSPLDHDARAGASVSLREEARRHDRGAAEEQDTQALVQ